MGATKTAKRRPVKGKGTTASDGMGRAPATPAKGKAKKGRGRKTTS